MISPKWSTGNCELYRLENEALLASIFQNEIFNLSILIVFLFCFCCAEAFRAFVEGSAQAA
jgi:hypothetical protein